jgi:acyl carrier protein
VSIFEVTKIKQKRTRKKIFEKVKEVLVSELHVEKGKVTMEVSLKEDLFLDEIDIVLLGIVLEEKFDIQEIPDTNLKRFVTVSSVIKYIEEELAAEKKIGK